MFKKIIIFIFLCFNFFQVNAYDLNGSIGQGVTPSISETKIHNGTAYSDSKSLSQGTKNDMTGPGFEIKVNNFSPVAHHTGNVKQVVNFVLGTVIQKMMIAIGAISLLVMTIGAGYMIFYHGQDELLSKGKSIINAGIIALIIALSSYYIVSLVRLILYSK